jgi:acetate kinase
MNILVFNPGGNSLKVEIVRCDPEQRYAFETTKLLSISIEGIGREPRLSRLEGKKISRSESIDAQSYGQATRAFIEWYKANFSGLPILQEVDRVAIRVVHGGREFAAPVLIDSRVEQIIADFEKMAPLHNKSSLEVLETVRQILPDVPVYGVFDTAFHCTIPDHAFMYAIPLDVAVKHRIHRYGFHGISHRYFLERYAYLAGKSPDACNIVSTHLESGCSVTAVEHGRSVDNTMGLTPLEGLIMGTRSGDVDPSLIPILMREERMSIDDVMTLLNTKSGLLGISGKSLDTRVLMKHYEFNLRVKLAMDMFAYRVRKAVGAYLAVLGTVDALIFGGGIGENSEFVRRYVCDGLHGFGIEIDTKANESIIDVEGRLSLSNSKTEVWVIPAEEGLQIAHECCHA